MSKSMHNNYFFLRKLVDEITPKLVNSVLATCFSQNKDELVLGFALANDEDAYLRADLSQGACFLVLQDSYNRARANSVDLFPDALDCFITGISMAANDRSFSFHLKHRDGTERILVFKMHGNRSNILLLEEGENPVLFRNKLEQDKTLTLSELDKVLDTSFDNFQTLNGNPLKYIPTLGLLPQAYLNEQGYEEKSITDKYEAVLSLYNQLLTASQFYVCRFADEPVLSLFPIGEVLATHTSALAATADYSHWFGKFFFNEKEKLVALRTIERWIKLTSQYIEKTETRIKELEEATPQEQIADIIMANMHAIPKGSSEVMLFDFYRNTDFKVKLNPKYSAQENATNLYRKGKNRAKEMDQLFENLSYRNEKLNTLKAQWDLVNNIENVKELRKYLKENELIAKPADEELLPYREFLVNGYRIWVGRNADANDALIQKFAAKNDIWLHARAVPGSHVIIKTQPNVPVPKPVLERAAELAAWFSKAKNDSLCPVIYTPKKFVRKVKGSKAGQVMVDKEDVIMVVPKP
jgi:predicted ribosome quality control (RQC) complex YloA/Tae2 family protein